MRVLRVVGGRKREKQKAADAGWIASVQPMPAEIMRDTANRKLRWWWGPNECCLNSVMLSSLYIDLKREYEDGLEQHLWDALNWQGIREKRWWSSHIRLIWVLRRPTLMKGGTYPHKEFKSHLERISLMTPWNHLWIFIWMKRECEIAKWTNIDVAKSFRPHILLALLACCPVG